MGFLSIYYSLAHNDLNIATAQEALEDDVDNNNNNKKLNILFIYLTNTISTYFIRGEISR